MLKSRLYRVKKYPPHSKRGGYFFMFGQNLNLMTLGQCPLCFSHCFSRCRANYRFRSASRS